MSVVADASTLITLHAIGHLDLVRDLFREILVPPAVASELLHQDPDRSLDVSGVDWIRIVHPTPGPSAIEWARRIGGGEREAIALALETKSEFLVDDRGPYKEAVRLGIQEITGVMGILLAAKRVGLIPLVGELILAIRRKTNFHMSQALVDRVLKQAGEDPIAI